MAKKPLSNTCRHIRTNTVDGENDGKLVQANVETPKQCDQPWSPAYDITTSATNSEELPPSLNTLNYMITHDSTKSHRTYSPQLISLCFLRADDVPRFSTSHSRTTTPPKKWSEIHWMLVVYHAVFTVYPCISMIYPCISTEYFHTVSWFWTKDGSPVVTTGKPKLKWSNFGFGGSPILGDLHVVHPVPLRRLPESESLPSEQPSEPR